MDINFVLRRMFLPRSLCYWNIVKWMGYLVFEVIEVLAAPGGPIRACFCAVKTSEVYSTLPVDNMH